MPSKKTGFTLIELLVVIAIIGLLTTIVSTALGTSRLRARDARRVSDMKQIKTGMDLYFNHGNGYPDSSAWVPGATLSCSGVTLMRVPNDPLIPSYQYTYTATGTSAAGCGGTVRRGYSIQFYIENKAATYTMDEDGVVRNNGGTIVSFDSLL